MQGLGVLCKLLPFIIVISGTEGGYSQGEGDKIEEKHVAIRIQKRAVVCLESQMHMLTTTFIGDK